MAAQPQNISIHALLAESDYCGGCGGVMSGISIHALLAESDLVVLCAVGDLVEFLSTLSLRRATEYSDDGVSARKISIHALLAESDTAVRKETPSSGNFYPRSPCGERHLSNNSRQYLRPHFYPRSPCGERHAHLCKNP